MHAPCLWAHKISTWNGSNFELELWNLIWVCPEWGGGVVDWLGALIFPPRTTFLHIVHPDFLKLCSLSKVRGRWQQSYTLRASQLKEIHLRHFCTINISRLLFTNKKIKLFTQPALKAHFLVQFRLSSCLKRICITTRSVLPQLFLFCSHTISHFYPHTTLCSTLKTQRKLPAASLDDKYNYYKTKSCISTNF